MTKLGSRLAYLQRVVMGRVAKWFDAPLILWQDLNNPRRKFKIVRSIKLSSRPTMFYYVMLKGDCYILDSFGKVFPAFDGPKIEAKWMPVNMKAAKLFVGKL